MARLGLANPQTAVALFDEKDPHVGPTHGRKAKGLPMEGRQKMQHNETRCIWERKSKLPVFDVTLLVFTLCCHILLRL
jgi:hypothetical protein